MFSSSSPPPTSGRGLVAGTYSRRRTAGAERVAHEAGEEAVAFSAVEPLGQRAAGSRRGGGALEHRHGAVVLVEVPPPPKLRSSDPSCHRSSCGGAWDARPPLWAGGLRSRWSKTRPSRLDRQSMNETASHLPFWPQCSLFAVRALYGRLYMRDQLDVATRLVHQAGVSGPGCQNAFPLPTNQRRSPYYLHHLI
jgi:hypothetical protein